MKSIRIFIDANIFLQMGDLHSLNWRILFPQADDIEILVSMHVVKELDKLKNGREERIRRRSRAALQIIEGASKTEKVIRHDPYRVAIRVAFPRPHQWDRYHLLDNQDPDDRLIAHVIEDGRAILVSDDSGVRIKAEQYDVSVAQPPASFRLPAEETPDQKKIRALNQRVKDLEDTRPKMALKLMSQSNTVILRRPVLEPLSEKYRKTIVERYLSLHPKKKPLSQNQAAVFLRHRSATATEWLVYDQQYKTFVDQVERHAAHLHDLLNSLPVTLEVPFQVINAGRVPVINADVAIRLEGNARLHVFEEEPDASEEDLDCFGLDFPEPPEPGQSLGTGRLRFRGIPGLLAYRLRMPGLVTFEWDVVPDEDSPREANLSNREFRVGKKHSDRIGIVTEGNLTDEATITFSLEARDLEHPVAQVYSLRIEPEKIEWDLQLLEKLISAHEP